MNIPQDPAILLSYINTMLRDEYPNLDELCKSLCLEKEHIENKLAVIGYVYNSNQNRFM